MIMWLMSSYAHLHVGASLFLDEAITAVCIYDDSDASWGECMNSDLT